MPYTIEKLVEMLDEQIQELAYEMLEPAQWEDVEKAIETLELLSGELQRQKSFRG